MQQGKQVLKFIFDTKTEILKKHTRIVDGHLITFKVISKRYIFFCGLIETESKYIVTEYDKSKVLPEEEYKINMSIKSLEYAIRVSDSSILTGIRGIDYDK